VPDVRSVKAVKFGYTPTPQTRELLETFRSMVNDAIRISLEEGIHGRLNLRNRIYKEFRDRYGIHSHYPYSVAEVAWSIVKKHKRWHRRPYAKRLMMKLDHGSYSINYALLSIPFKTGQGRILVTLEYGYYQRSFLMDEALAKGSITMTESAIIVTFSKEVESMEAVKRVGYDLNEKSLVGSDGTRIDLSEVARLHTFYGIRRCEFYSNHPNDRRLKKKFAGSRREKERVKQFLHRKAKEMVEKAKKNGEAIVLEKLKGIRYKHERGNGKSRGSRRRIALWPFSQLQSYIKYKADWSGVPVEYVSAAWTSKTCFCCGFVNKKLKLTDREWLCPRCGVTLDRDLNAAINIERRGKIIRCLGETTRLAQEREAQMKP